MTINQITNATSTRDDDLTPELKVPESESQVSTNDICNDATDGERGFNPDAASPGMTVHGTCCDYRLECSLGRGGYGSVYLATRLKFHEHARNRSIPEQVAIKLCRRPAGGGNGWMFRREVSSLLTLEHERIIRLYDHGEAPEFCFLVLDYYERGSCMDGGIFAGCPLDEPQLFRFLRDMLSALNAAHQSSILHLDIKPGNVLRDQDDNFVLTDFGISQGALVSHHVIETGLGSPGYQAPEQRECNRRWIGPRTDLWSVGATAWALYTGIRLDLNPDMVRQPESGFESALPRINDIRTISPALEEFIDLLLRIDPTARPGGAAEGLARLNESSSTLGFYRRVESHKFHTGDPRVRELAQRLVDPLWSSIVANPRPRLTFVEFNQNEIICAQGEHAFRTFVLLSGTIQVERDGVVIATDNREGTFLGENATLTGQPRTASIRAVGRVLALMFNAAELEQFVVVHPAVGLRLMKTLALRSRINNETHY